MRCRNCSTENPEGARFCIECATPFPRQCSRCGAENPAAAKFCAQCAQPLSEKAPPAARGKVSDAATTATGERRHLTVLFSDLVGSTEISTGLDPEEFRELVASYHAVAAEAITRFGGYVAKYL